MKRGVRNNKTYAGSGTGTLLRDFILGGQDGLVNVLGLILGVATATQDRRFIIIAGLSALFAESISMGAVAYTSSKAQWDFYRSERAREQDAIKVRSQKAQGQVRNAYARKGFSGKILDDITRRITSNKKLWLETLMVEDKRLFPDDYQSPTRTGWVVFLATVIGSLIPLIPFFFLPVVTGAIVALIISGVTLFAAGVVKAKLTTGTWLRSGIEMLTIGVLAAASGYIIGEVLHYVL